MNKTNEIKPKDMTKTQTEGLGTATCSPIEAVTFSHLALQKIRPLLVAIINDENMDAFRREKAKTSLELCDLSLITTDEAFQDCDLYL